VREERSGLNGSVHDSENKRRLLGSFTFLVENDMGNAELLVFPEQAHRPSCTPTTPPWPNGEASLCRHGACGRLTLSHALLMPYLHGRRVQKLARLLAELRCGRRTTGSPSTIKTWIRLRAPTRDRVSKNLGYDLRYQSGDSRQA